MGEAFNCNAVLGRRVAQLSLQAFTLGEESGTNRGAGSCRISLKARIVKGSVSAIGNHCCGKADVITRDPQRQFALRVSNATQTFNFSLI